MSCCIETYRSHGIEILNFPVSVEPHEVALCAVDVWEREKGKVRVRVLKDIGDSGERVCICHLPPADEE